MEWYFSVQYELLECLESHLANYNFSRVFFDLGQIPFGEFGNKKQEKSEYLNLTLINWYINLYF